MKNKKKAIIMFALVLAVIITGFSVSGTYAKYVSSIDITDEARVAKWGVNLEDPTEVDLFKASYAVTNNPFTGEYTYVASSDGSKVVAPGTKGEYTFKIDFSDSSNPLINNYPEVNYKIIVDVIDEDTENNVVLTSPFGTYYDPLIFHLDGSEGMSFSELVTALENLYTTETSFGDLAIYNANVYAAGNGPATTELKHTISWEWPETTTTKNAFTNEDIIHDDDDTELGNKFISGENPSIKLKVQVRVEQTTDPATAGA